MKNNISNKSSNAVLFYSSRIIQRLSLCFVIGSTIIHWIIMIVITANIRFIKNLENHNFKDPQGFNELLTRVTNTQSLIILRWTIITAAITLMLLLIKRYRKYNKPLIVDSFVIMAFCVVSVAFSQM